MQPNGDSWYTGKLLRYLTHLPADRPSTVLASPFPSGKETLKNCSQTPDKIFFSLHISVLQRFCQLSFSIKVMHALAKYKLAKQNMDLKLHIAIRRFSSSSPHLIPSLARGDLPHWHPRMRPYSYLHGLQLSCPRFWSYNCLFSCLFFFFFELGVLTALVTQHRLHNFFLSCWHTQSFCQEQKHLLREKASHRSEAVHGDRDPWPRFAWEQ